MPTWIEAAKLDAIESEGSIRVDHEGKTYAVFRPSDDEVYCTDGLCTHEKVHLSDGLLMDYEIECPKHSGIFDVRTGEAKRLPACVNLTTYPARIDGDRVLICIN